MFLHDSFDFFGHLLEAEGFQLHDLDFEGGKHLAEFDGGESSFWKDFRQPQYNILKIISIFFVTFEHL